MVAGRLIQPMNLGSHAQRHTHTLCLERQDTVYDKTLLAWGILMYDSHVCERPCLLDTQEQIRNW